MALLSDLAALKSGAELDLVTFRSEEMINRAKDASSSTESKTQEPVTDYKVTDLTAVTEETFKSEVSGYIFLLRYLTKVQADVVEKALDNPESEAIVNEVRDSVTDGLSAEHTKWIRTAYSLDKENPDLDPFPTVKEFVLKQDNTTSTTTGTPASTGTSAAPAAPAAPAKTPTDDLYDQYLDMCKLLDGSDKRGSYEVLVDRNVCDTHFEALPIRLIRNHLKLMFNIDLPFIDQYLGNLSLKCGVSLSLWRVSLSFFSQVWTYSFDS